MIVDVVMFDDEFDMLDCRLYQLDGLVDRFIVCEADASFSGVPKPYFLSDAIAAGRYPGIPMTVVRAETRDSTGHSTRSMPWITDQTDHYWWREEAQRNAARDIVSELPGDTVVMYGDLDEIPRRAMVQGFSGSSRLMMMQNLVYSAMQGKLDPWPGTVIGRRSDLGDDVLFVRDHRLSHSRMEDAGWHLSWFGSSEQRIRKLAHTAHQELASVANGRVGSDLPSKGIHVDGYTVLHPYRGDLPAWVTEGKADAEWTREW